MQLSPQCLAQPQVQAGFRRWYAALSSMKFSIFSFLLLLLPMLFEAHTILLNFAP
jgi:hypothetical protein